jgi:hypothetical protein
LKSLLSLVPSLLGDLLLSFLLEDGIGADGGMSLFVEGLDLLKEKLLVISLELQATKKMNV